MFGMKKVAGLALLATLLLTAVVSAQPLHLQPGSALVYPLFDSATGAGTLICVTNLNESNIYCQNSDYREGDVVLHYVYVDGDSWREFDRFELLTPGDTLCVIADQHNPEQEKGFLVVSAVDPSDMTKRVPFNNLIGSAIVVQSDLNFLWSYTPYAFESLTNAPDACNLPDADTDGDGALDFDGTEYSLFPETLYIDSFFEEGGFFDNQLTLLSTAGSSYTNEVAFLFWNNIEQKFSRSLEFTCWWSGKLSDVSNVVTNLNGDPDELGQGTIETGWASIAGRRVVDGAGNPVLDGGSNVIVPPLLGVFTQFITGNDFSAGHALHYKGTLDGLEVLAGDGI